MSQPTYQRREKVNYASEAVEIRSIDQFGTDLYVPYVNIPQSCASEEVSIS